MKKFLVIISGALLITAGSVLAQQTPSSSDTTGRSSTMKQGDNSDLYRKDQSGTQTPRRGKTYNSSTRQTDSVRTNHNQYQNHYNKQNRQRRQDGSTTPGNQYRSPVDSASSSGSQNGSTTPSGSTPSGSSSSGTGSSGTSGSGTTPKPGGGQ